MSFSHYRKRHYRVITGNWRDQEYNHREYDYRICDYFEHKYKKYDFYKYLGRRNNLLKKT